MGIVAFIKGQVENHKKRHSTEYRLAEERIKLRGIEEKQRVADAVERTRSAKKKLLQTRTAKYREVIGAIERGRSKLQKHRKRINKRNKKRKTNSIGNHQKKGGYDPYKVRNVFE